MTKKELKSVLESLNSAYSGKYEENEWLDCEEISAIILHTDENIYPGKSLQVKFDLSNELLFLRKGFENSQGLYVFEPNLNKFSNMIDIHNIAGVVLVSREGKKEAYKIGASV